MLSYFAKLLERIQNYSTRLDNSSLLMNQKWVLIETINKSKVIYIFRSNNQLLISKDGIVEKGEWDCLDQNTLLIETKDKSYLYRNGFFDELILVLKLDNKKDFSILVNENKSGGELNTLSSMFDFKPSWTNCGIKLIDTFLINNLILFIRLL